MQSIEESYIPIQKCLCAIFDLPSNRVILANQNRGSPPNSEVYATYWPEPIRAHGWPLIDRQDAAPAESYDPSLGQNWKDFRYTLRVNMLFTVTVNIFNGNAQSLAMRIPCANFRPDVQAILRQHKIGWQRVSNIRNLTSILQAGIQPRFNIDIDLWATFDTSFNVLRAARAPFTIRDADTNTLLAEG